MHVHVTPPDPEWSRKYASESARIAEALGSIAIAVHHIGSTAIPDIHAKPIVDMCLEVVAIEPLDAQNATMEALGYQVMGEYGIAGRRYFRKNDTEGRRIFQVHAFRSDHPGVERHLAFRDFMIAHPEHAHTYSELKRRLAAAHPTSIEAYMDGKDAFIKDMERRALAWRRAGRR